LAEERSREQIRMRAAIQQGFATEATGRKVELTKREDEKKGRMEYLVLAEIGTESRKRDRTSKASLFG